MTVEFVREAERELVDSAPWYECRESGLGARFRDEMSGVVARIGEDPTLWRMRDGGYRRVNCPVFPVVYIIREERVVVMAVAHSHRRPEYFGGRRPE